MRHLFIAGLIVATLAGCGQSRMVENSEYNDDRRAMRGGRLLDGQQGISLFGVDRSRRAEGDASALGVNAFLWRASLDTLSFMPISSADPFGGVILTDWYSPPATPGERFRAQAYILGRQLRSDGVRVSIFRQELRNGVWVDSAVSQSTATDLEDRVLARARELRSVQAAR